MDEMIDNMLDEIRTFGKSNLTLGNELAFYRWYIAKNDLEYDCINEYNRWKEWRNKNDIS